MNLIPNFSITPFSQISWVSLEAKNKWENVVRKCSQLVQELEVLSVYRGQRACAWRTINKNSLPNFTVECAEKDMTVLPVKFVGNFDGFIHYTPQGDSNVYCIISKSLNDALRFKKYFENGDHVGQGAMLGFPKCCSEFFSENWKRGYFDPIWQIKDKENPHPLSNPLLRYLGLRIGFHIPCSFHCEETIRSAQNRIILSPDQEIIKLLTALLSMPMSWDAKFGQAVIRTPIFYFINYTVPTFERYVVQLKGNFIPKESVRGNCFPFILTGEQNV